MEIEIKEDDIVVCLCEGNAEQDILELLLENDLLRFNKKNLLNNSLLPRISGKDFEDKYLKVDYGKPIIVIRVLDSRSEKFKLSALYKKKVGRVIDIITSPEIEMLIIINENKVKEFDKCKSNKKPNLYCKTELKMKDCKKAEFVKNYFNDPNNIPYKLLESIKEYKRIKCQKDEYSLWHILKAEYQ